MRAIVLIALLTSSMLTSSMLIAQDDLLAEIDTNVTSNAPITSVFKGLKIVNFESTKLVSKQQFMFVVAHRFGSLKNGVDTFFGLDDAVTRLNFIYGLSDGFNISISRSSYQKLYESAIKYKLIKQRQDMPVTVVGYHSIQINTALDKQNLPKLEFKHRLGYTHQILVSRKFNDKLSLQLAPTFFHDNFVQYDLQDNTQFALGLGGRYKLTTRWSINMDYGLHLNRASNSPFRNPLSIGVDLETGGHVFQMHLTNAQPMNTNAFLSQSTGDWSTGNIYFGFNLSRIF